MPSLWVQVWIGHCILCWFQPVEVSFQKCHIFFYRVLSQSGAVPSRVLSLSQSGAVFVWRRLCFPLLPSWPAYTTLPLWSTPAWGEVIEGPTQGAGVQSHPSPQPLWPPHGLKWWGGGTYCHLQARQATVLHPQLDTGPPPLLQPF